MQEYISKQQQIRRPAEQIYEAVSRFDNLTPALADKVEEWEATEDRCSFKAKGFSIKLRMEERIAAKQVKIVGDDGGVPVDFAFWIQLQEVAPDDTRRHSVHPKRLRSAPLRHRGRHATYRRKTIGQKR